jgi:hypothetical protein
MSRRFPIIALLTASFLACLMAGCWPFDPTTKPKPEPPPPELLARTTPENVLFNLRVIYGDKDNITNTAENAHAWAESYRTLFRPDTFTFWFVAGDQPPDFPDPWWGVNYEVTGFDSLLTKRAVGIVDDITLSWTVNASEPDNRIGPPPDYALLHPTWRHIYVTGILLDVVQGTTTWRVPNGTADFYFAPDPANSSLWVITEWYDHQPLGSPPSRGITESIMPTTSAPEFSHWGQIKALYH